MKAQLEKAAGPRPPRTRRVRVSAVREGEAKVREDREVTVTGPEAETKANFGLNVINYIERQNPNKIGLFLAQ